MMKRSFFGIILGHKQKYTFKKEEGLYCYYINNICLSDDGEITIYGNQGGNQLLLATMNSKNSNFKCRIIMNEQNIQTVFAVGKGTVHLSGYQYNSKNYKPKVKCIYHDEFKALQPIIELNSQSKKIIKMKKKAELKQSLAY